MRRVLPLAGLLLSSDCSVPESRAREADALVLAVNRLLTEYRPFELLLTPGTSAEQCNVRIEKQEGLSSLTCSNPTGRQRFLREAARLAPELRRSPSARSPEVLAAAARLELVAGSQDHDAARRAAGEFAQVRALDSTNGQLLNDFAVALAVASSLS
ncbi:MAG: hypothetical protein ACRDFT_07585, partial [bacterium]